MADGAKPGYGVVQALRALYLVSLITTN